MQSEAMPRFRPFCLRAFSRVTMIRVPLAPIGCPSAVAPPSSLDFGAFVEVLTASGRTNIPMSIVNSVIITGGAILGLVVLGSLSAYVIARRTRAWSTATYYLVLIAIIILIFLQSARAVIIAASTRCSS